MTYRFGIDLGGTKIELIALDETGTERHRQRIPTPQGDYAGTVQAITGLIGQAETELGISPDAPRPSVGVGIPGTISPATGLVKNSNSVCLIGKPFDRDLERSLGRPVKLANDADCFTLSEAIDGAGAGASSVFGVILGTGVGGGLVINKAVVRGPNAITGEWGHNPLPWPEDDERPGPACYCGLNGCIETFLSGPGLVRDAVAGGGTWQTAAEIADAAIAGGALAKRTLARHSRRLAKALATVINIVDPEVIVLGGGLSNISTHYQTVPEHWDAYVFSDTVATKLVSPVYGDSSGVRGAAWLWQNQSQT